ncbi:MAG: hypothetical protein EOO16_22980 [Chitinophagaceae bacterium]|nr:MAG: hypothetical protein EOO16_22980 [Chitinophagaceae bacterium]
MDPYDTVARTRYEWDAQNRISSVVRSNYSPNNGAFISRTSVTYSYNGADTIAARQIVRFEGSNPSADTFDVTYGNGRILIDSIHGTNSGRQVFRFEEMPGGINWNQRFSNNVVYNDRYYLTGSRPNYTSQLDTTTRVAGNGTAHTRTEMNVSYLGGPNPFYRIAAATPYPIAPSGRMTIDNQKSAPSRLIATRTTQIDVWGTYGNASYPSQVTYSYQYRADGYPVRITEVTVGGPNPGYRTLALIYR